MRLIPLHTPTLSRSDDLASLLSAHEKIEKTDIVVISSKAIAMTENACIELSSLRISDDAKTYAAQTGLSAAFMQAVLEETKRLHGVVRGTCPGALLIEVRPDGLPHGTIFAPNAGLDQSNVPEGTALGWPHDPVASAKRLSRQLDAAVIVSDSCCLPRRMGVTAFALACAGLDPLRSEIGSEDLFGKKLQVTVEAVADQLAVAANYVMGNAAQSVPAAIIRDHGLPSSEFSGWVPGIEPEEDLFRDLLSTTSHQI